MDNLDFTGQDAALLDFEYDLRSQQHQARPYSSQVHGSWPLPMNPANMYQDTNPRRVNTTTAASASTLSVPPLLNTSGLAYTQSIDPATLMAGNWNFNMQDPAQQAFLQDEAMASQYQGAYAGSLQASPIDFSVPVTTAAAMNAMNATLSMDPSSYLPYTSSGMETMNAMAMNAFGFQDFQTTLMGYPLNNTQPMPSTELAPSNFSGSSPAQNWLEVGSLSSDDGWTKLEVPPSRQSMDSFNGSATGSAVVNPGQTLHIRSGSDSSSSSDGSQSIGSFEEIIFPMHSPHSEASMELSLSQQSHHHSIHDAHSHCSHPHSSNPSVRSSISPLMTTVEPIPIVKKQSASSSASPISPSSTASPPSKRKKSPVGKTTPKTIVKKSASGSAKKDGTADKRVGRRKGPLRPEQRAQAHEIRKLGACLRCKFLKKTCDKGEPCAGCQPSHTRLWQVPCTRIDIKDIAFFMKDWKADYERHVTLGFSIANIKGYSQHERPLYITHGYGFYLPITVREVYVRDDNCFDVDWIETCHEKPTQFEIATARLAAGQEGISSTLLSEYLDRHIDGGFERFIDEYFEGTYFVTEIFKTAYRYYLREKLPVIRKALKLVVAYNLTLHVTMCEGLQEEESLGKIEDEDSKYNGKTVAPVMINFQVKYALAEMWRELQRDILEELSSLFSSVYSGDRLKNWPTIFMLAAILLAVWEEMQFDCHYRVPDQAAVQKFCQEMETIPVGVIVGLFTAISQKLPSFTEWDTRKHHQVLNSNPAVCDALTEVRSHVLKYDDYLRTRSDCKFDRSDFDCLSNKFLSKLVIRAN